MLPSVNFENRSLDGAGLDIFGFIGAVLNKIINIDGAVIADTVAHWWGIYSIIAILLSILFFVGFIYAKIRYGQLVAIESAQLHEAEQAWAHTYGGGVKKDARWADILNHISGPNPGEWRLAIIEADILLDETLQKAGYVGSSIGEMLKSAKFATLNDAWEAHKVRNDIAHSGRDFVLTKKLAQDTITQFERVFREFGAI